MKRTFSILVLVFVLALGVQPADADGVGFVWVKQAGGTSGGPSGDLWDMGRDIIADSTGNIIVVGSYYAPADFDGTILPGLGSSGTNAFVAKYDPDGNLIWVKNSINTKGTSAEGVAVDNQNNIIVTGTYDGVATFDSVTFPQHNGPDVFIVKYDTDGNLLWAKDAYGNEGNASSAVATDGNENIFITGSFAHHNYGGWINFDDTILNTWGGNDIFVAKYDTSGNFLWARQMGSTVLGLGTEQGYGITTDMDGNAYVIGTYKNAAIFGDFTLGYFGGSIREEKGDIFITKFDPNGKILWAKQVGGIGKDIGRDIVVDAGGDLIVTGHFRYSAYFDEHTVLSSYGGSDIFIAKYDTSGNLIWAKQAGGIEEGYESDASWGLSSDMSGNIYITGNFRGTGNFDDILIPSAWDYDIFIAKLNSFGNFLWAIPAGAINDPIPRERSDLGHDVTVDENNRVYVTGNFVYTGVFGNISLVSNGIGDMFVARLGPLNSPPVIDTINAPLYPVSVDNPIEVSATFTDPDTGDVHTALWHWGDNNTSSGTVNETDSTVTGSHTYLESGVYTLTLTITDSFGEFDEAAYQYVVIYDPEGGFVTGGGWIMSPEGAYASDPTLTGKANFGFVSKYKNGATTPTGNTEFQFKVADLNFKSTSYDWLVIAGSKAMFKGTGTINGEGEYKFMLSAIDGDLEGGDGIDKFRIKIWDKATETVIYDNQLGDLEDAEPKTELGGGSIVIHKK